MRHHIAALGLGLLSAAGLSIVAKAADMAPAPVLRGALPASDKAIDWSGFYAGGAASYGTINTTSAYTTAAMDPTLRQLVRGSVVEQGIQAMPLIERGRSQNHRIGFGVFAGYNWMMEDYVIGVEADYTRAKLEGGLTGDRSGRIGGTVSDTQYDWTAHTEKSYKITDYGSVRGRLGYAWDNWMPYVTAGVAYARTSSTTFATIASYQRTYDGTGIITSQGNTIYTPASLGEQNRAKFFFGYALGAGLDVALSQNIVVRAELQHLRFANVAGSTLQLNQAKLGAAIKY
jgi:outer membrane immunogenic protein